MKSTPGAINVPIAIFSLTVSIMLWAIVMPNSMSRSRRYFDLQLTKTPYGYDAKRFFIAKQKPTIRVHATISEAEYKNYVDSASAEADLSNAKAGTNMYPVSLYPPAFRKIVEEQNPQAEFTLEAVTSRDVPVTVITGGKLTDPTQIVDTMIPDTKKVSIEGPTSAVKRVVSARATLRLDTLVGTGSQAVPVTLDPVDAQEQVVDQVDIHPDRVMVTPQFSIAPQTKQAFVDVTFSGGQVPAGFVVKGYTVEPSHVTVSGSSQSLARIAKVSTEPIDLSQLIQTQTVAVKLRATAKDVSLIPKTVRVTIVIGQQSLSGLNPYSPARSSPTSPKPSIIPGMTSNHR